MASAKNPHAVALGRIGGSVSSPAKTAAARLNGLKGGQPRKQTDDERVAFVASRSKYEPHQGLRERKRRAKQSEVKS